MGELLIFCSGIITGAITLYVGFKVGVKTSEKTLEVVLPQEAPEYEKSVPEVVGYDWEEYSNYLSNFGKEPKDRTEEPNNDEFEELN
jgi:beta-lactam-binding protein with PASTA domain